jgi:hypothetical protein
VSCEPRPHLTHPLLGRVDLPTIAVVGRRNELGMPTASIEMPTASIWSMCAAALLAVACESGTALDGPMCTKGKRCGNTCIAVDKTCHVDDVPTFTNTAGSGGSAVPPSPVTTPNSKAQIGDPCTSNHQCEAPAGLVPFCVTGVPGGACSAFDCRTVSCGAGNACLGDPDSGIADRVCLRSCHTNADCRTGYECAAPVYAPQTFACLVDNQ